MSAPLDALAKAIADGRARRLRIAARAAQAESGVLPIVFDPARMDGRPFPPDGNSRPDPPDPGYPMRHG